MTMVTDTRAWLAKSLTSLLGVEDCEIVDGAHLVDDLGADSLDVVELTMAIEDSFKIKIADAEMTDVAHVGEVLALIDAKVAAR